MERIESLDYARGFTVFFIPVVHAVVLYGSPAVHESQTGYFLHFIAEWPGAQVFMLIMGVLLSIKGRQTFKLGIGRGVVLLASGYLLNAIKFVLPLLFGLLPANFLQDLGSTDWRSLFLIGDILHFSGIAYILLYVINCLPGKEFIAGILAVMTSAISWMVWDLHSSDWVVNHMLELFGGQPPGVFFPVFPWLVYPLAGFVLGERIKLNKEQAFIHCATAGLIIGIVGFLIKDSSSVTSFYRTNFRLTLLHLSFVLLWVSLWYLISARIRKNVILNFFAWLSKRITVIYLIQWPVICWLLPFIGYQNNRPIGTLLLTMLIVVATLLTTLGVTRQGEKTNIN